MVVVFGNGLQVMFLINNEVDLNYLLNERGIKMKLSQESKDKIREAYIGDLTWLDTIAKEITKYDSKDKQEIEMLLNTLYKMNYVIMETETEEYAEKYYDKAHELYSEMKIDLTKMLGIEDIWEEM